QLPLRETHLLWVFALYQVGSLLGWGRRRRRRCYGEAGWRHDARRSLGLIHNIGPAVFLAVITDVLLAAIFKDLLLAGALCHLRRLDDEPETFRIHWLGLKIGLRQRINIRDVGL